MRESRILYFALGVLCVTSIGAVSLHDNGVEFADGSFQESAAVLTAAYAVQGHVSLSTSGFDFCTQWGTLYSVPSGKRLVVEWMSVETGILAGSAGSHPVDVTVITYDGSEQISHPIVRIEDPVVVGGNAFGGNRWSGPVTLYSEEGVPLLTRMCGSAELDSEPMGFVTFSGYLIDV